MYTAIRVTPYFEDSYGQILAVYWNFAPSYAFLQLLVVIVVWMHGAIGLYSWLVLKPIWRRIGGFVLPVLFAVPILGLLGFASAGQEVLDRLANDPAWKQAILDNVGTLSKATRELAGVQSGALKAYGLLVLLAFGMFGARVLRSRMRPVSISYDGGRRVQGRYGLSILEIGLLNDVPHAHVCSGRGRCGTCRVRIDAGAPSLSPVGEQERSTLERVQAEPGVRLACQARVLASGVVVTRLLPAFADATAAQAPEEWTGAGEAASREGA
jgi:adenylate cyclase